MKRTLFFVIVLLFAVSIGLPSSAAAMACTADICVASKSDMEAGDIGNFKYHQYSYSEGADAYFQGQSGMYLANGTYRSVAFYIEGDQSADYSVGMMEFPSREKALELMGTYLGDNKIKDYKNSYGTAYMIEGVNGNSISWLHKNVMISVQANSNAEKKDEFFKQAFNVYAKKFPPSKINSGDIQIKEKIMAPEKTSRMEITSPKFGGSALIIGSKTDIKWKADKKVFPKIDVWITDSQNPALYRYIATNLKNTGKFSWKIPANFVPGQYQLAIAAPGDNYVRYSLPVKVKKSQDQLKKELKDALNKGVIKDYVDCSDFTDQIYDESDRQELSKSCDDSISKKILSHEKNIAKSKYSVCGTTYKIESIGAVNGVDRLKVLEGLMKTGNAPKNVCSDFNKILKGKEVSLEVRDINVPALGNYSILTLLDAKDKPKRSKGGEIKEVSFSFDWLTGMVRYFPSTLETGDAIYLGNY